MGNVDAPVLDLQMRLVELDFMDMPVREGLYCEATANAVREVQRLYGFPVTGEADGQVLWKLGLGWMAQ